MPSGRAGRGTGWRRSLLLWLYDRLTRTDPPAPADLIFVLAGKMERKQYGLELYHAGLADRLLLSVGRFEVSKMPGLPFDFAADLIAERNRTAPEQRHFFCDIDARGARIYKPALPRWNTYGEASGLREHISNEDLSRVIVVSTDIHLRRVASAFDKVFRGSAIEFRYRPVPPSQSSVSKEGWWTRAEDRKYVMTETVKLAAYRVILLLPQFLIRYCMRLRD